MIDLTQFDNRISLPPKLFKNDVQNIGIVHDHATDKPSETRLPAQLPPTTASGNDKTARYNIYDAEDDNAC
eukprot:15223046-Heterocapsa_arctica.AAC.1